MKITIIKNKEHSKLERLHKHFTIGNLGEIYIAIGGDGTFIKAAQQTEKPVLLIRDDARGSVGYHSDVSIKDIDFVIKSIENKDYYVEHLANKIEIVYKNKHYFAINEAKLNNIIQEVSFKVYEKEGNKRTRVYPFIMSGDGMLVTSKIGSTAYNLSAGGPIILASNVLCLTFLNPDGPYGNPIILDTGKEIEIEIVKYEGILGYDFTQIAKVKEGDKFTIKLSNKKINVVRFRGRRESLADKLERKIKNRMSKELKGN
jgi:NAD+ kinase